MNIIITAQNESPWILKAIMFYMFIYITRKIIKLLFTGSQALPEDRVNSVLSVHYSVRASVRNTVFSGFDSLGFSKTTKMKELVFCRKFLLRLKFNEAFLVPKSTLDLFSKYFQQVFLELFLISDINDLVKVKLYDF